MEIGDLKERVEIEELNVATNGRTGEQLQIGSIQIICCLCHYFIF
jgi:hypothetical protein